MASTHRLHQDRIDATRNANADEAAERARVLKLEADRRRDEELTMEIEGLKTRILQLEEEKSKLEV